MNQDYSKGRRCRHEMCACTVLNEKEEYCSKHCRGADHGELADKQAEVSACACDHDECAAE
ncbi:MAG: hypothetical protein ACRES7_10100 [Gammaproteobacteria bacterium]